MYPFPIDEKLASQGQELFVQHCAKCHGTYGTTSKYPNKIVALDVIGTDSTRLKGLSSKYFDFYNESCFAKEKLQGLNATTA